MKSPQQGPQLVANIYPPESQKIELIKSAKSSRSGPCSEDKKHCFHACSLPFVPGDFLPGSDQGCHNCHRKPMPLTVSVPNSTMGQWVLSAPKPVESRWSVSKPVESRWTWKITRPQSESSYSERAWTCKYKKKQLMVETKISKKKHILGAPRDRVTSTSQSLHGSTWLALLWKHQGNPRVSWRFRFRQDCCMSSVILRMT